MAIDPLWIWIALGAVTLLVIVGLFARGARKTRSEALHEKFGSEYHHAVQTAGSRKRAEHELAERAKEIDRYDIRPLTASERDRYRRDWQRVEQHFLERPTAAVVEADELVADIMRVQGYPMGDFDKHAAHLSVKHPRVVEHYRAGHRVIDAPTGGASTEDLRQAMLHYRALFDDVIGNVTNDVARDLPRENEVIVARPVSDGRDEKLVREEDVRRRP